MELRQQFFDPVHDLDDVGARLALDVHDDGGFVVAPRGQLRIFHVVQNCRDLRKHHRRAVAVGHHDRPVILARDNLVVGVDLIRLLRAVEIPLGLVDAGLLERGADIFQAQSIRRKRRRIHLDAHRGLLAAADGHKPHAGHLRNLLRQPRVRVILDFCQRNRLRCQRQREDRGVGGIGLAVDRRGGEPGRQIALRGVDRSLDLLLGHVDVQVQRKLKGDDGAAAGADRRHLVQAGQLSELAFQRRRDRRRDDIGACTRIKGDNLDGRVIHLRQGRNRQLPVGDQPGEQDRHHQQRCRHRAQNEWARRAHREGV